METFLNIENDSKNFLEEFGMKIRILYMKKNKKHKDYSIRSINVKLDPIKEHIESFDKDIKIFSLLQDIGVNRYAGLPDPTTDNRREEAKKLRKELTTPECTGTFVDLAIGERGADSHFRNLRKMAIKDIYHRDKELKKIEKENPNLTKLESIWFNPVKNVYGECSMCGREGKIFWQHNEQEYNESLCEVCKVDFFAYREPLATLNRNDKTNYFLCKDLPNKEKLSKGLLKEINRFDRLIDPFKGTVSNKFKLKGGQWGMDFESKMATITLSNGDKIQVPFSGDYYYNNFPKYGLGADIRKFRNLIEDHICRDGYASIIRTNKDGKNSYYLSIPTHYPMQDREQKVEEIEGCILVSQRKVLLYINGKAKFVELYNPYLKKRIYGNKNKEIQQENANLCICDWNRIPKKNHMLLLNLKKKLGFDWINENEVTLIKSDDGNRVTIIDDNDDKRMIEISINRDTGIGELRLEESGISHISLTLHIVERKKNLEDVNNINANNINANNINANNINANNINANNINANNIDLTNTEETNKNKYRRTRRTDLYLGPQVPMPKKYSGGNLLRYIRHKNKEVARQIVEEAKKMLNGGTVVLIDYKGMHPEGESIVPIGSLNDQVNNMLGYDSIYGGSIYWGNLKELTCPNCHTVLPEKKANRFIIRDIFLSDMTEWECKENHCNKKINNPLIAVARHIMTSDIKKLLKKPTKKDIKEDEEKNFEKK